MKYLKKTIKIISVILGIILLIIIIDYLRLNLHYLINKNKYKETFDVKGNHGKYVPQGLTYSEKYDIILQTSYNSNHTVSKLYITDFKTGNFIKELKLKEIDDSDNVNHVGGITTDNKTVWITNDYEVNEYSLKEILTTEKDYITSQKNTKLPNRGDFCFYDKGILWIGDFFLNPFYKVPNDNPLMMGYEITNIDYQTPKYIVSLPKMVQGLAITKDNKFIFTRSFTNLINSDLVMYDNVLKGKNTYYKLNDKNIPYYKFSSTNKINNIKLPPMAEGLFYKDNNLYILFENSSDTYFYALPKINKIIKLKIDEIKND